MGEYLGGGEQVGHVHPFVGAVEVGHEARHAGPKGHPAGDVVDVGAAADGNALALSAAVLLITFGQDAQEGGVGADVVGGFQRPLDGKACLGHGGFRDLADGRLCPAQRGTAVKPGLKTGFVEVQQGEGQAQVAGEFIPLGNAQGLAGEVPVGEQPV